MDIIRVDGMATRCELDCQGIESQWDRDFPWSSRPLQHPTSPPPHSSIIGTGYFSRLKPPASGVSHTLLSDAEVVNDLALHFCLPSVAAWACHGVIFAFTWVILSV